MSGPWGEAPPGDRERRSFADAEPRPYWLDRPEAAAELEPLSGVLNADLAIVGGGLSGFWAALLAKEEEPGREVALLEAGTAGIGASGRNGGFILSSLTHGVSNGLARFEEADVARLERLGRDNIAATAATLGRHGIECDLELVGDLAVALEPHEEEWLAADAALLRRFGHDVVELDGDAVREQVASPLYRAGIWNRTSGGIVDPARLTWGLRDAARRLGVRVFERTPATRLRRRGAGVALRTPQGELRAGAALLATSAEQRLLRRVRRRVVPVYDYVLITEPLDAGRRRSIGWRGRQGIGDSANRFHYYRLTADDRILWGGYDAIYHYGSRISGELEQREESFGLLAKHFFATFPQLEGIRFTHRWAGAIDTCSRFFAFYGSALGGRVAYVAGHTGLGVGASRFGARTALDLLAGRPSTGVPAAYRDSRPLPFPPEPLRWAAIELTRNRLAAADRNRGRRGAWLRLLDRLGAGFDS